MIANIEATPDIKLSVKQTFGIESEMEIEGFSKKNEFVPEIDKGYKFDRDTTLAILSGFSYNKSFSSRIPWNRKIYPYRTNCS